MRHVTRHKVRGKTNCNRKQLIVRWLKKWLWAVFDRTMKAFFDAFFDHLRKP